MALPQALGTDLPPIPGGIAGDVQRKVRAGAEAEAGMAEAVAAKTKELTAPIQAAKEQEVGTQQAKITSAGEQLAKPLEVPKETVQDMAALGGLAAVVGAMLGSSGKMSAQNVLGSMTGILDGYKKGNNDLITKYQKEFDMNQKRLQSQIQQAQTELSVILEKYKVRDQTVAQDIAAFSAKYAGSIAGTIADAKSASTVAQLNMQLAQMGQSAKLEADRIKREDERRIAEAAEKKAAAERQINLAPQYQNAKGEIVQRDPITGALPTDQGPLTRVTVAPKATGGAGDRFGFGNIVAVNLNEAVGSIGNIVELPFKVTTGAFQGRNTSGLLNAPLGALTNNLTKEDVQRYNAEISNFGKFASRVVSGGRVVPASVQQGFEEQYKIREGDKPLTVLTKIAMMRQTLERAAQVYLSDPNTPDGTKEIYRQGLKDIEEFIPFTVNDVNKFANSRDNKTTFSQVFPQYGFGKDQTPPSVTPSNPPAEYPNAKQAPDGNWYIPDPARQGKYLKVN